MKTPEFWQKNKGWSEILFPFSALYYLSVLARGKLARPKKADIPVICVGNVVAGGAGKTPVAIEVGKILKEQGVSFAFISRGYGGLLDGPVEVNPDEHTAEEVGDEPLLLARTAPCIVSKNRLAGINKAAENGAKLAILDDGLQNPSVIKDFSLLVIDGLYGIGNGYLLPAGPLRDKLDNTLRKSDMAVLVGEDKHNIIPEIEPHLPVLRATIQPSGNINPHGRKFIAFAGIGYPEKFFNTLENNSFRIMETRKFADHHNYNENDIKNLLKKAEKIDAELITTEKDLTRIPPEYHSKIITLPIEIIFEDEGKLIDALQKTL